MQKGSDNEARPSRRGEKRCSLNTHWAWRLVADAPVVSILLAGVLLLLGLALGWDPVAKAIGLVLAVVFIYFIFDFVVGALKKRETLYNWVIIILSVIGIIFIVLGLLDSINSGRYSCNRFDDSGC